MVHNICHTPPQVGMLHTLSSTELKDMNLLIYSRLNVNSTKKILKDIFGIFTFFCIGLDKNSIGFAEKHFSSDF